MLFNSLSQPTLVDVLIPIALFVAFGIVAVIIIKGLID